MRMEDNCRLCRKLDLNFPESIFNMRNGQVIADIVMKVCPISEIYVGDGFPNKICDECLEILLSAYDLQKISVVSDNFYRQQMVEQDIFVKQENLDEKLNFKVENQTEDEENCNYEQDANTVNMPFDIDESLLGSQIDYSQINRTVKMTKEGTLKTLFNPRPVPGSSKISHPDKYYACNFCDAKLKPRNNMIRHMLRHDPIKKPFACNYCLQRFDTDKKRECHEYNMHMNETTTNIIVCEICGATGDHQKGMDDHKRDDHKKSFIMDSSEDLEIAMREKEKESIDPQTNLTRRRDDRFHPRPLPGQESQKYEETWYTCNFCDKQLKPRKNILRHIKLKHDPESLPFGCTKCVDRFKTPKDLSLHEREKHDNEVKEEASTIFCEICGISGNSIEGMENHKADDHSFRPFSKILKLEKYNANDVVVKLPDAVMRTRGVDLFHPRPLPGQESLKYDEIWYSCNFCKKEMKPRKSMMRHMRLKHHPRNFPFGCRFCIERFDEIQKLESHEKSLHKRRSPQSIMFCDLCGVSGDNREGMENHMIDDHTSVVTSDANVDQKAAKSVPCKQCDMHFENKYELDQHKTQKHEDNRKCSKCNDVFSNRLELRNHILMVHDQLFRILDLHEVQQDITCCACDKSFDSEHAVLKHLNVHSKGFESVKCSHSSKPHVNFNIFYKHVKHQTKPKTHQCLKCLKIFPLDARFIDHLNSHKRRYQRKKLSCDKCDGNFRTRHELDIHDKIKHQQETLFICEYQLSLE